MENNIKEIKVPNNGIAIQSRVNRPDFGGKSHSYRRARYRGLSRNGMDFALHAIAYNFKRSFSLQEAVV